MAFDVQRSQQQWRETWDEDAPTGDVGTRVLFENDHVRIWHLELAPGESSPLHTHANPYLFVVIESARVLTKFPDGTTSDDVDPTGEAVFVAHDDNTRTHTLNNIDDKRYVNRVIELLDRR